MADRIVFDMFDKSKNKKQTTNERDADEIKVTGAIITTDKNVSKKGKKTIKQTDIWGEGSEIKALEGATMEDKPLPAKTSGKFTNSKKVRTNWNAPLKQATETKKAPAKVGTWGDKPRKSSWNDQPKPKGSYFYISYFFLIDRFQN
jgi:hypothetical protein